MDMNTLDCSDLDRWMGVPLPDAVPNEPVQANDIRRWAQAMHYPNRNHYDAEYAAGSRFGGIVAPQSFAVAVDDGHGCPPAAVGNIPDSHLIFGGDEWWFYGPGIAPGDLVHNERVPYDYVVKDTRFAGPTCFQRGDNNYINQRGEHIAKQRSTAIRYSVEAAHAMRAMQQGEDEYQWSDAEFADIEQRRQIYIRALHELGHSPRLWSGVAVGDELPTRVIGPHSLASFATEWRAYSFTVWGTYQRREDFDPAALGFLPEMAGLEGDPETEKFDPQLTDGAYYGPSRGHLFPRWARHIGMPRGYGYGASMGAWMLDYIAGWAGEWGRILHANVQYRAPALTGDITIMDGRVAGRDSDASGRHFAQLDCVMKNQLGDSMAKAVAEVELPLG